MVNYLPPIELEVFAIVYDYNIFYKKLNLLWPPFLKKFSKVSLVYFWDTLEVEKFNEIALSVTVKEIEAMVFVATVGQNSKIQNGRHFWKKFQKSAKYIP